MHEYQSYYPYYLPSYYSRIYPKHYERYFEPTDYILEKHKPIVEIEKKQAINDFSTIDKNSHTMGMILFMFLLIVALMLFLKK